VPTSTNPHFLKVGCPSCRQTNSVKALKALQVGLKISAAVTGCIANNDDVTDVNIQQKHQQQPFYGPLSGTTRVSQYQK